MAQAPLYFWGTGRRKTAVARIRVKPGTGEIKINGKSLTEYFPSDRARIRVRAPILVAKAETRFDVYAQCHGGGMEGQSGACAMGIARALVLADGTLEVAIRGAGFLTRDSRMKERKKYGQKSARANFQFSKR